jgi:hypothetical protein
VNGCAEWSVNNTVACVGVSWGMGTYGPEGIAGGSQCFFKWTMQGSGAYSDITDGAQLLVTVSTVTTFYFAKGLTLFRQ